MSNSKQTLNRRKLIKASLAGAAVTATASPAVAAAEDCHRASWDREVDVIVVGSGTGLVAALVAAKANKEVLILEKSAAPGGTTVVSGGIFWIPNNNIMQREGLSDSREQALAYLQRLSQGQAPRGIMEAFVDNGPKMADFIEANTALELRVSKLMGEVADYHPEWNGSNLKGRSLEPVQPGIAHAGGLLVSRLLEAATASGAELLTSTPARRLLAREKREGGRRVIGVQAEYQGRLINIRARDGVLVASGGFERNDEMKTQFLRGPSPYTLGAETNTGDGIHMGMAIGADLRNMNEVWALTAYKGDAEANGGRRGGISLSGQYERRNPGCIAVNRYGERFCNEAADYDSTWRVYHTWENWGELGYRNLPAFHLFDQNYRERFPLAGCAPNQHLPEWVVSADTLEELADRLGIDKTGLAATVERFNRFAGEGRDPQFHRGESAYDTYGRKDPATTLAPLARGPFYGAEITPADLGTCGGLRVDGRAQVVDVFGQTIDGLYASGNTSGVGSPGTLYGGGGGTMGPAMTFAYIAGMELAAR